jgi:hypothetical protein
MEWGHIADRRMQKMVNEMHDLFMQAKGMRWLMVKMAAGFLASFASK